MSERYDRAFLKSALGYAQNLSKDPNTQVGAVIVGPDREGKGFGFNGFPRGIADTAERLNDRDLKLKLIVHAEENAILGVVRPYLLGTTLYFAATDESGMVWGGPPCTRCTVSIIQAGIAEVVSYTPKSVPSSWAEDLALARKLLIEAGIRYREVDP